MVFCTTRQDQPELLGSFGNQKTELECLEGNIMSCKLKEIAILAGVSTATVSRVVNGSDSVSADTRTRVSSAIVKFQYAPNSHAVQLGRANGGIPKLRGGRLLGAGRQRSKNSPDKSSPGKQKDIQSEQLRLLKEENSRLGRLLADLSRDLEMTRTLLQTKSRRQEHTNTEGVEEG